MVVVSKRWLGHRCFLKSLLNVLCIFCMRQVDPFVQNNKDNYTGTDGGERSLLLGKLPHLLQQEHSVPVTSVAFLITFRGLTTRALVLEGEPVSALGFAELSVEEMLRESENK